MSVSIKKFSYREPQSPSLNGTIVFCAPAAGMGARGFMNSFRLYPRREALRILQLPGREERLDEQPIEDFDQMTGQIAAAVAKTLIDEGQPPFVLFGHSFGALVMFEVARELVRVGMAPERLALAACASPDLERSIDFGRLDSSGLLAALRAQGSLAFPAEVEADLLPLVVPSLVGDCRAYAQYMQRKNYSPIDVPILAMCGQDDRPSSLARMTTWHRFTESRFVLREFTGGHFFPLETPSSMDCVFHSTEPPAPPNDFDLPQHHPGLIARGER